MAMKGSVTYKPVGSAKPITGGGAFLKSPSAAKPAPRPSWKVGGSAEEIARQLQQAQSGLKAAQGRKRRDTARVWQGRIDELNKAQGRLSQGLGATPATLEDNANLGQDLSQLSGGWIAQQGQFQPGDFGEQRQKAADAVYGMFTQKNEPLFQQQQEALRTEMMNRGVSETSPMFAERMRQLQESQNDARMQAQNQAFLTGQGEQAQGFGQALSTWQTPYNAFTQVGQSPQMQMQFSAQQAELQRKFAADQAAKEFANRLQVAKAGRGGGGGGLSFDQQVELMRQQYIMNTMGMIPQQQPNSANSFWGGVAQGGAAGVIGGLRNG
jgi:hypothetical protein